MDRWVQINMIQKKMREAKRVTEGVKKKLEGAGGGWGRERKRVKEREKESKGERKSREAEREYIFCFVIAPSGSIHVPSIQVRIAERQMER